MQNNYREIKSLVEKQGGKAFLKNDGSILIEPVKISMPTDEEIAEEKVRLDNIANLTRRLATLETLMRNSYLFIKKIAMKKPFLNSESAINEQYNSYNTMYNNALKGLFDKTTNKEIIQAHEEAEARVANINLVLNNIRAKFEYMIENNIDDVDKLLAEAIQEQIKVEDDFTISDSEINRLKNKYGV